jgi:hypothetical protein
LAAFIALCKGYLGINPYFDLWRHFSVVNLLKSKGEEGQPDYHHPMGCVGIHLRNNWYHEYMPLKPMSSNKGGIHNGSTSRTTLMPPSWHTPAAGIFKALVEWKADVPSCDEDKIANHLLAIEILKEHDLKGVGVIGAYHARGVAPLMRRALSLFLMAPDMPREGTTLAKEVPSNDEVVWRMKSAMGNTKDLAGNVINTIFPVPGHASMHPKPGCV